MGFYENAGGIEEIKDKKELRKRTIPIGKIIMLRDNRRVDSTLHTLECCRGGNCTACFFRHTLQYRCPKCMSFERRDGIDVWFREV